MKIKEMFEETDRLGNEITRLHEEIDKISDSYYSVKNETIINIIEKIKSKVSIVSKGVSLSYFNFIKVNKCKKYKLLLLKFKKILYNKYKIIYY